jgi:hypothetical protein
MKALILASTLFALASGCNSACDELSDRCEKCKDNAVKASCEQYVSAAKLTLTASSYCQNGLDSSAYDSCK